MNRSAGILLPVSSLPSKYGIGDFGKCAYDFVDWLKEAGQSYWQILPLVPTSYGDSPYQSPSSFAGNPYFIDLEELIKEGLLTRAECDACDWGGHPEYVDYGHLYESKYKVLRLAFSRGRNKLDKEFFEFIDTKYAEIPRSIKETKVMSDEMEEKLILALGEFKAAFR